VEGLSGPLKCGVLPAVRGPAPGKLILLPTPQLLTRRPHLLPLLSPSQRRPPHQHVPGCDARDTAEGGLRRHDHLAGPGAEGKALEPITEGWATGVTARAAAARLSATSSQDRRLQSQLPKGLWPETLPAHALPTLTATFPATLGQVDAINQLGAQGNVFERLAASIAPEIYGMRDVKKVGACLGVGTWGLGGWGLQ
jgi:hypothetical protein